MTPREERTPLVGAAPWPVDHVRTERLPRREGLLASWYSDITPAIGRRIRALEAIPGLAAGFAYPFPHNYALLQPAVRRDRTVDDVLLGLRDASRPLNDADEALNDWFDGLADRCRLAGGTEALDLALAGWRASRAVGRNLQGVMWAERACAAARAVLGATWSLAESLDRSAPEVLGAFLAIPDTLRSIRRLRIFVAPDDVPEVLARLDDLGALAGDWVDGVETAKPGLGPWDGRWPTLQLHPTDDAAPILEIVRSAGLRHELRVGYRLFDRYLELLLDARQQRSMRAGSRAASVQR